MAKIEMKGIDDLFTKLENSIKNCNTDVMETTYIATLRLTSLKSAPSEYFDRLVDLSEKFQAECKCIKKS